MHALRILAMMALVAGLAATTRAEEEFKISGDPAKGEASYKMYCVACHGATGAGDGAAAAALNPKPRALNDKAYMDTLSDQHIYTVIKDGGAAVGKSMFMTAWGAILKEDQAIHDVAAYVRTLAH
ncbi:MAG TPA: cytochrome c [Kiritimatiellia bacterium]|nr:cytochrome c [Kiritimatiellia bacterium]HMP34039.1 cytochrome c [Kiritimatiellia bacterium]